MPETVKRTLRIITKQHILADVPPVQEGFPMRQWSIQIFALNQDGEEVPAVFLDRVTYKLHPTFTNPTRVVKKPPFLIEEQGWGEFDLQIVLHTADRGGDHTFSHDLNFLSPEYTAEHTFSFPTNKPGLNALLEQSGPVPPPASSKRQGEELEKKPKKPRVAEKGSIDLEKLAGGLEKLNQEHLLSVVQMVTDNKTPDMYIKNDPLGGEFHMDLYTLPDPLLKSLWEYVKKNAE